MIDPEKLRSQELSSSPILEEVNFLPWEVLDRKIILDAQPWLKVWLEKVRLPDGHMIPDYYKLSLPNASVVVPVTDEGEVFILRQYKHGLGATVWGLPGGFCSGEETSLECAKRELLEEIGCEAEEWIDLGGYAHDASRGEGCLHVFLAKKAFKVSQPNNSDFEEYQIQRAPMANVLQLVRNKQMNVMGFVGAVLLAHLYLQYNGLR